MRKSIILILLLAGSVIYGAGFKNIPIPRRGAVRSLEPTQINYKNAIVITPDDDLQAEYDWLASSDRDAEMGALSYNNPRTLYLAPGRYERLSAFTMDTPYIRVLGMGSAAG
ncbi:MAG: hypothetical protein PHS81_04720, partial [Candidatus Nanoarchaeia archaeon]|nr:hypothetical protein [Candidatus Nanoarchaeia archaeon]